jgi:hypothetical protein
MGPSERLNDYIRSVRRVPFLWGRHDCLIFSNAAFSAFHGFGYADDWIGEYMSGDDPMRPSALRQKFKAKSFDEAIAGRLDEITHVPPRGALVATKMADRWAIGYALGISVGTKAAFLSKAGVVYFPLDNVVKSWVPR